MLTTSLPPILDACRRRHRFAVLISSNLMGSEQSSLDVPQPDWLPVGHALYDVN